MSTTVISKPEGLCFSGNLPKVKVQSDAEVRVQLLTADKTLLDETYTPDFDSLVSLDIADVVINELTFTVPSTNVFVQQNIRKNFVLKINTTSYNFSALRCGIKDFNNTPVNFLTKNFLTWQPKMKKITLQQPEFLTYHATQTSYLYITAYFETGNPISIPVTAMSANNVYTVNISAILKSALKRVVKAEAVVCATNSFNANKISKYQYYTVVKSLPDEQYFLFENSLGGIDTVCCTGEIKHSTEFTRETALMSDTEQTFFAEKSDIKTQTTGWLTKYDTAWLLDFFMSKKIYLFENNKLNAVIIDEITAETSSKENLRSFEFTYRPDISSDYLIIYEKLTEYISAAFVNQICQKMAKMYASATFTNPICQKLVETYISANYANPVCQKIEQTITYVSATYTSPVCQQLDDTLTYISAEYVNPICQLTDNFGEAIRLDLNLKKHPLLDNRILITWQFSEDVEDFIIAISLESQIQIKSGMITGIRDIDIVLEVQGTSGIVTQTVDNISSFIDGGTEIGRMRPDEYDGRPIIVRISLN
ncbi:MAG: hypothetical protein LBF04_03860 [Prevotellaceae bacterium]|jgi:hypothetical protein|nr:hypothetical protein [Prevotellaceae bacterium]